VLRGVGIATVAAVAVTGGAVVLSGTGAPARAGGAQDLALHAPVPSPVAAVVPAPVVPVQAVLHPPGPDTSVLSAPLLDGTVLSDAVTRAQNEAHRLADEARAAEQTTRDAEERARKAEDEADDARRTTEQGRRIGRLGEPDPAPTAAADCDLAIGQLGAVKPFVRTAAEFLGCAFNEPTVLGVAGRSNASDHPKGRALDFMVDRATGDRLAACALRNREELGVSYVIWRQRIDTGSGFRPMADRGSPTANHFDHVHVSFEPGAGSGSPISC